MSDGGKTNLTIRFCTGEWIFSVYDSRTNSLISHRNIPAHLPSLSEEDILRAMATTTEMQQKHESIRFVCESDNYSIVPEAVFDPNEAFDLLSFQIGSIKDAIVLSNSLSVWKAINVFAIPKDLYKALLCFGTEPKIEHHLTTFVNDEVKHSNSQKMYVWLRGNKMDVVVLKNGNIGLVNSYDFQTPEDFVYYILNVFEQLALDVEGCAVYLHNAEEREDVKKIATNFVNLKE